MIKISPLQKNNPILALLKNLNWCFDNDLTSDFEINKSIAILFLSLKYHVAKPEYILKRITMLKKDYRIKVILVILDTINYNEILKSLYEIGDFIIILNKNIEESAEYIKAFQVSKEKSIFTLRNKSSDIDTFLLSIPKLSVTEIGKIKMKYKNLQNLFNTSTNELEETLKIGKSKVNNIINYFNKPFIKK